ncbi:hypothetical protein SELMODRAFT_413492 [Selaginella moellendorffii]|uniref:Uncharacterized protein n=1 Tax=Selaginella moellendorffii TaxID=88036 RepID=D8RPN2_SELML|nr:hypothetical protein SELMODRAFT_413492 [Selaginella moellendorffii]
MHVHVCMLVKQTYENNFGIEVETEYYVDRLSIKDCRMEALCYTQSSESVVKWLEEQHKCEPGRTNGDLERYLTSKVGYKTHFEILLDFCVKHDCHCLVMKKWGMTHGNSSTGYGLRTLGSFPASSLVQVAKKWGESSFPHMEEFWEKTLTIEEAFEINSADALVLLLAKFHEAVRKLEDWDWGLLVKMKKAAGLFGLNEDEKVTQLFSELLPRALKYSSHNKKLAEVAIWLGNEEMVKVVVKYARSGNFNDEKDDSSLIESAKTWDDVARYGLKKVINDKICYFLGNGDEEELHNDTSAHRISASRPSEEEVCLQKEAICCSNALSSSSHLAYIIGAIYWQVKLQVIVSTLYDETVLAINGATLITQPVSKAGFVGAAVQHKIEALLLSVLLNCHGLLF